MSTEKLRKAVEAVKWLAGIADERAASHLAVIRQALRDQEAEIARYRRNLQAYVDNGWTLPAPMIRDLLNGTEILTAHLGANND